MIPSPIHRALSSFRKHKVRFLLMGGQACILYGGAEFSRDLDLAVSPSERNLARIREALAELHAEGIFVPPLSRHALERGHACHFRCCDPEAPGLRIDLMSKMRGCQPFEQLWRRRDAVRLPELSEIGVLSLRDLVRAKKTQRDKDWPMVRRLIEADMLARSNDATEADLTFWLEECRTPEWLIDLAAQHDALCRQIRRRRPLLECAMKKDHRRLEIALREEEERERESDRVYWDPLRRELREWRRQGG